MKQEKSMTTFMQLVTLISFCEQRNKNDFTTEEILSMFAGNLDGRELYEFRKQQTLKC